MQNLNRKKLALERQLIRFSELFQEHDFLVHHVLPKLEERYLATIGIYAYKVNEVQLKIMKIRRKIQLIQAAINRMESVDLKKIDEIVDFELCKY
ncbi:MAG: hypothetical protein LBM95_08060 [Lactobacillales bacterium]|nr:hypothetical protein [Lactobacillales bacterium]